MRHFLNLLNHDRDTLLHLLKEALRIKSDHQRGIAPGTLRNKVVALIFEKPSLRTRVSFEAGVSQLGGSSLFLPGNEVGLGQREPLKDFARTMSQYVNALVLRVFKHSTVEEVAQYASIPVINGLSDTSHPCQAMADFLTILEVFGSLQGKTMVFVGDGNNVARSLAMGCGKLGLKFILCCPEGYGFDSTFVDRYKQQANGTSLEEIRDPAMAVQSADVIYTDVWTSMGQESEKAIRLKQFAPYQVNKQLLAKAPKHVKILHCLPAHRDEEITDEAIEAHANVVFQQAGNRLHAQKAILEWLLK